jgi:hypothetical protein
MINETKIIKILNEQNEKIETLKKILTITNPLNELKTPSSRE